MDYPFSPSRRGSTLERSTRYEIRPRSFGEILDGSFQLYRDHFKTFLIIASIVIPPLALFVFFQSEMMTTIQHASERGQVPTTFWAQSGLMLMVIPFWFCAQIIQGAALTVAISNAYLGQPVTVASSFRRAFSVFGSLMAGAIVSGIGTGLGILLCFIPGVIFFLNRIFYVPAIVVEGKSYSDAFSRSKALVFGHRQRIGLMLLLLGIIQLSLTLGLGALVPDSVKQVPILGLLLLHVPQLLVMPLAPAAITLAYFDARVRKEAFDLEVLSRETFGPAPVMAGPVA